MKLLLIMIQIGVVISAASFYPIDRKNNTREVSPIEEFAQRFSRQHKTWTEDNITIASINKIFTDSLNNFYDFHKEAFNNLVLRLENVVDSGNGKRMASFECWDHFVDNKQLRAHVYADIPDTIKKLFIGNDYIVKGMIEKFDVHHGAGYSKVDNTCDVGIVTLISQKLIHLKGHNKGNGQLF